MNLRRIPSILVAVVVLAGCADTQIQPVAANVGHIKAVYVQRNPTADAIAPELESVIEGGLQRHGIGTRLVDTPPINETDYILTYTATAGHDLKDFMKNAEIRLKHGSRQIGYAIYTSGGGLSVSKFDSVHDKIDPLLDQMLASVR